VAGHTATTRYPQFEGFIDETLEEAFSSRTWNHWFHHQDAELAKAIQAYQQAVADEDDETPSAPAVSAHLSLT
jgi:hypothetical protein